MSEKIKVIYTICGSFLQDKHITKDGKWIKCPKCNWHGNIVLYRKLNKNEGERNENY